MDAARRNNHVQIIQLLEQRNNVQDAAEVASNSNTLGNVSLRDIGDEIDNIEAIQAVMISEKQIFSPDVPECPVCFEDMKPPIKIYNCTNGHLICADCKDRVTVCTNCREPYMGRATAVEQMLRQMFNCQ